MLVNYLRSSSVGTLKFCQQQYYLNYCLGLQNRAGPSATKGTIFHLVFELRGLAGIAHREGKKYIEHDVFGKRTVEWAKDHEQNLDEVIAYVAEKDNHIDFEAKIKRKEIAKWCVNTLEKWPEYDPFTMKIKHVEYHFDIVLQHDWAKYEVELDGKKHKDNLRIVGTIDNIVEIDENTYQIYDLKTGKQRSDFATGEEKTIEYMRKDHQLLFYLYACKQIWPDKDFVMTLAFINAKGNFTVVADDEMYNNAEKLIKKSMKQILNMKIPTIWDRNHYDWRCKYCCEFSKPDTYTDGKSVCQYYADKLKKDGIQKTTADNIDLVKLGRYGAGAGREDGKAAEKDKK